jgi:hypothetical protein
MTTPISYPPFSPWQSPTPHMAIPGGLFGVLQGFRGPFGLPSWAPGNIVAQQQGGWPSNPIGAHAFSQRGNNPTFNQ